MLKALILDVIVADIKIVQVFVVLEGFPEQVEALPAETVMLNR